jgi:hypothetical protein
MYVLRYVLMHVPTTSVMTTVVWQIAAQKALAEQVLPKLSWTKRPMPVLWLKVRANAGHDDEMNS